MAHRVGKIRLHHDQISDGQYQSAGIHSLCDIVLACVDVHRPGPRLIPPVLHKPTRYFLAGVYCGYLLLYLCRESYLDLASFRNLCIDKVV